MDNFEHFSRALSAMAKAGAYSARDIRDYIPFDASSEINRILIDSIQMQDPYTAWNRAQEYEHFRQEQEKHQRILNSWPYRLVAFLNELIDAILNDIDIMGDFL
jgi:hypothetical protein